MQRTTEVSPAAVEVPEAADAQTAVAEATTVVEPPKVYPRFASIHTLLVRAESLADVGSGSVWIRNDEGIFIQTTTDKITREGKMSNLLDWIAAGRVGVLCDHRYLEFDELTAEWPRQSGKPLPEVPTV
jgi:hypothetical protein